jgi:Predicted amino acid aldolase or racemase
MAAGAIGICCTTVGEAEVMAGAGIEGVLITSPVVTPPMIDRLVALNKQAKGLMVVADNPVNVDALAAAGQKSGKPLSVIVEFDVGQGRTGVTSVDGAIALARASRRRGSAILRGFRPITAICSTSRLRRPQGCRHRADGPCARPAGAAEAEGLAAGVVTGGGTGTSISIPPAASTRRFSPAPIPSWIANISRST